MEGPTAKALANNQKSFLNATHYKMAHHGLANEEDWLKAMNPTEVHVSHMYNHGRFHHPRCEAFSRLFKFCNNIGLHTGGVSPSPHVYTCFEEDGTAEDGLTFYRIYNTAPRKDLYCLIVLTFVPNSQADRIFLWQIHVYDK